jgi:hypothetical protein
VGRIFADFVPLRRYLQLCAELCRVTFHWASTATRMRLTLIGRPHYGCRQGHGLHLEIDPLFDSITWGPGTLVVYLLIYSCHDSKVTRTHSHLRSSPSLFPFRICHARGSGPSGRFYVLVLSPPFIHGSFFRCCNYTPWIDSCLPAT